MTDVQGGKSKKSTKKHGGCGCDAAGGKPRRTKKKSKTHKRK